MAEENNGNENHPSEPPESPPDEQIIKGGEPPLVEPELLTKMLVPGKTDGMIIKKIQHGHKDEENQKDKDNE